MLLFIADAVRLYSQPGSGITAREKVGIVSLAGERILSTGGLPSQISSMEPIKERLAELICDIFGIADPSHICSCFDILERRKHPTRTHDDNVQLFFSEVQKHWNIKFQRSEVGVEVTLRAVARLVKRKLDEKELKQEDESPPAGQGSRLWWLPFSA